MAEILAGQGANLALADLDHAELQDTIKLCAKAGGKAKDYPVDVTDEPAVEMLLRRVPATGPASMGSLPNAGGKDDALLVRAADGKRVLRRRAPKCVVPDVEAGNILVKSLSLLARAEAAGIVAACTSDHLDRPRRLAEEPFNDLGRCS
jgi:NAD(P)-dependent dehydrogenase (short-subunit alcohol dehydrogenase family)